MSSIGGDDDQWRTLLYTLKATRHSRGYLATAPPWMLRICCLRWSGRQKYLPQRVQVKVYRDPRRPHSYLECRVRDDRDLYPRPHITHRNGSSPSPPLKTISAGLAASIQGEAFYIISGFLPDARNEPLLSAKPRDTSVETARPGHTSTPLFFSLFLDRWRKSSDQACGQYWIKLAPKEDCAKSSQAHRGIAINRLILSWTTLSTYWTTEKYNTDVHNILQ